MIASSVLDPALFSDEEMNDRRNVSDMVRHLDTVARCHVLLLDDSDDGSLIWGAIRERMPSLPVSVQQALRRLSVNRRVLVTPSPVDGDTARELEGLRIGEATTTALGVGRLDGVSAVLGATETKIAVDMIATPMPVEVGGRCLPRVFDYTSYIESDAYRIEQEALGTPLTGKTNLWVRDHLFRPVLRWAKHVRVIDKMIARVAWEHSNPTPGHAGSNWPRFRETVLSIYQLWRAGYHEGDGIFEVVTLMHPYADRLETPAEREYRASDQARLIAHKLGLDENSVGVRVKTWSRDETTYHGDHDRYLWTNNDVLIGFSAGFDLSVNAQTGVVESGDVYLRRPVAASEYDAAEHWLSRNNEGRYPASGGAKIRL